MRGRELDSHGNLRGVLDDTAEEELRTGRPRVFGPVSNPDIGDVLIAQDGVAQIATAPDQVGFWMGFP